jgi:L,D-peptidoglycan transpeptidase YkuD (ErfK/YbiS/YcfS/YnhG family)
MILLSTRQLHYLGQTRMKRVRLHRRRYEFTTSANLRQKVDIFSPRGPHKFIRFYVRELPRCPNCSPRAILYFGSCKMRCAIGQRGVGVKRREGDAITPVGKYKIIQWMGRFDRWRHFRANCRSIAKTSAWCDDPRSFSYNCQVSAPSRFRTESLWREDYVYDLIGVTNFNFQPRVLGRGSAIFVHLAHINYSSTAGCVALSYEDMRRLRGMASDYPQLVIGNVH